MRMNNIIAGGLLINGNIKRCFKGGLSIKFWMNVMRKIDWNKVRWGKIVFINI
jgi:hypothetical protein